MRKLLLISILLVFIISINAQIRRSDVINIAKSYSSQIWNVITTNTEYSIFSNSGDTITGTAYSYGDKNTASSFLAEIEDSLIPRNWQENYNDSTRLIYTGIDCSGLVTRALHFSDYLINNTGASNLSKYSIKTDKPLPGDIYASSHHCFLQGEDSGWVYEANSTNDPDIGNRVQYYNKEIYDGYKKLTIFPLFSSNYDKLTVIDDSTDEITISGSIKCSKELSGFKLLKNGLLVTPSISGAQKSMTYDYSFSPVPGEHYQFICYASNIVNGNAYYDSIINDIYYLPEIEEDYHISDSLRAIVPYAGYVFVDKIISIPKEEDDKILLAGDSLGVSDHWVDDIISMTILHPDSSVSSWEHSYSEEYHRVVPLPPTDLTEYFMNGTNYVRIILQDDIGFGVYYGCSDMWLVKQAPASLKTAKHDESNITMKMPTKTTIFNASIYDITGRKLMMGTYNSILQMRIDFESRVNKSGVFFYTIQSGDNISSGKLCIMK